MIAVGGATDASEVRFAARLAPRDAVTAPLLASWQALVTRAAEPNPFYEPWALLSAFEHLGRESEQLLLIERHEKGTEPLLVGLAPISEKRAVLGLLRIRQIWTHRECHLGTPLVDSRWLGETASCLALWLTDGAMGRIERIAAGPVAHAMLDAAPELRLETCSLDRYSRALCDTATAADADAYLARSISHKHRKELRRQHNRLMEVAVGGGMDLLADGTALDAWVEEFLALESKGWKGQGDAALRTRPPAEAYFRALCRAAWTEGRLQFIALRCGVRAVAMKCNLLAPPGAFAIKICFDEEFARYSPGTHMELYNVEQLFGLRESGIRWMDSCASRRRWLVDRMWGERRGTETLLLARTRGLPAALLHLMPLVIWVRRLTGAPH